MNTQEYRPHLLQHLKDPEYSALYLTEVLAGKSPEAYLYALRAVVDARGESLSALAERMGITRQGLHKLLSTQGNPRLSTLNELLRALGLRLTISCDEAA